MRLAALLTVVACLVLASAARGQDGDAAAGRDFFRRCQPCHEAGEGAANKIGPVLNGVLGRRAGTYPGFGYSQAISQAGRDGLFWTAETLSLWLASPRGFLAGNKMAFAGIAAEADRANVIAYLWSLSPDFKQFPKRAR